MYYNLLKDSSIFSIIPIYFRSIEDWHMNYNILLSKYLDERKELSEFHKTEFNTEEKTSAEIIYNRHIIPWRYNEILAYLELRLYNDDLYFYLYKVDAKKFSSRMSHKRFLIDLSFEFTTPNFFNISYMEQKQAISDCIVFLKKKNYRFKKYFYDIEMVNFFLQIINKL